MAVQLEKGREQPNILSITSGGVTWIDIEDPTPEDIDFLRRHYPFHPLDLDDCLSRIQLPKIDDYEDYVFVILHFPVFRRKVRQTVANQVSVFLGKNYLITLHMKGLRPLGELFRECRASEEVRHANMTRGTGYLLYRIVDRLVDYWFPLLNKILERVDRVEDQVFDENVEAGKELAVLRRDLIAQRRLAWPMRDIAQSLVEKLQRFTAEDMTVYFGDTVDHLNKVWHTLDELREMIEVYKDTDFTLGTERVNSVLRVLTIIFTVLLPFMLISGIYGMNVGLPGGLEKGGVGTFVILMALSVLSTGTMLYFFRRKHWI
jgi:magnesium transporter